MDAYIAAFEPFVFAECRAELRQEWQEVCDGSKNHYEVIVTGVEAYEAGEASCFLRHPLTIFSISGVWMFLSSMSL